MQVNRIIWKSNARNATK